jgi:hypothetical protein
MLEREILIAKPDAMQCNEMNGKAAISYSRSVPLAHRYDWIPDSTVQYTVASDDI